MEIRPIKIKCEKWGVCDVLEFQQMGWILAKDKNGEEHIIHKADVTIVDGHQRARILTQAIWGKSI